MCAAPNNFNPNLGLIPPTVPPQQNLQAPGLQQFGAYPVPPYPVYPGIPGYPGVPPGYPAIPIPIPLQQLPQNGSNNSSNNEKNSDDRRSSKRNRDSKSRSHGSHRRNRNQDDYRDRKRGRDRDRDRSNEKNQNKRPIHTVFYFNIPYDVTNDEFREFASKFGEITNVYPIFDKGIAFVTYNDLRDAQRAVLSSDVYLHNRKVKRDFASKPPDHARKNPCDTCSTVLVTSLEDVSKIKADDVIGKMREFGEIRNSSQDRPRSGEFVIRFFKLRDAKNCVDHNGLDLRHETLKIEYLLDDDSDDDSDFSKGKRGNYRNRSDYDYSGSDSDSDDNSNNSSSSKQPQQQQLSQQQILQMQMQFQQYQQMQLQQLQQIQQLQGQFAPQPIPPPPPLQAPAATAAAPAPAQQPPAFPPFGF